MLINAEINIAFSSGTHTPFVQVFRILCMTSTPQPLSSSQIQARTQETSVSLTQSSRFSEFDLSCSLLVLLQVILLQKCCPKHGTLGTGNLFPSKRSEHDKLAQTYLVGDWDASRSSDSIAQGKYQHCWHDKCKTGWLYALVSSHQSLSWNIFHCIPVFNQKRTTWSCK